MNSISQAVVRYVQRHEQAARTVHWLANSPFIPGWQGNTARRHGATRVRPVHPRVGGEHSCCSTLMYHPILRPATCTDYSCRLACSLGPCRGWYLRRKFDQLQSIEIHRHPAIPSRSHKLVPLISGCGPRNCPITILDELFNLGPNPLPYAPGVSAHVNSGSNLQQPYGQSIA